MTRVRRDAGERARLIDEWRGSGLSLPAFCARRGVNAKTMSGWIYKSKHKIAIANARQGSSVNSASAKGRSAARPSRSRRT